MNSKQDMDLGVIFRNDHYGSKGARNRRTLQITMTHQTSVGSRLTEPKGNPSSIHIQIAG